MSDVFSFKTWVHAFAGSLGGVLGMATFYPLETVRLRVLANDSNKYWNKSTFDILSELVKNEGILTLYRGISPVLISVGASNFVYFYAFHGLKRITEQSSSNDMIIGMIAGIINVLVTTPLWVVNSRLRLKDVGATVYYTGLVDGLAHIARSEGIRSLWSGLAPSLVLVINPALQFMFYEGLKRRLLKNMNPKKVPSLIYFILAVIAKTLATVFTYPLQLIQARLRYGSKKDTRMSPNVGLLEMILFILKRRGLKGLFVGLEAKIIQTVLTSAFMFTTYEKIVNLVFSFLLK